MSAKQTVAFIEFNLNNQNLFNTEYSQQKIVYLFMFIILFPLLNNRLQKYLKYK